MVYYGEYGGRVLVKFKGDKPWIVGAEISAEEAMTWPLANRKALFNTHKVEWYGPPLKQKAAPQKPSPAKPKDATPATNGRRRTR